jgi:hypothetical protein
MIQNVTLERAETFRQYYLMALLSCPWIHNTCTLLHLENEHRGTSKSIQARHLNVINERLHVLAIPLTLASYRLSEIVA